ncbi:hypothetical protein J6590_072333 [Homalodisca vitripennis]|nr:hypothetical protein J6590_072333 [Homalodisca vitripennis]
MKLFNIPVSVYFFVHRKGPVVSVGSCAHDLSAAGRRWSPYFKVLVYSEPAVVLARTKTEVLQAQICEKVLPVTGTSLITEGSQKQQYSM